MKKKRIGILLLCCMLAVAALSFTAAPCRAADSGVCGDNLTWEVNDAGTLLTIKGTGDMTNFAGDLSDVPWKSSNFTAVMIEPGVTSIGNYAFTLRRSLTKVTIPESVTRIGMCAFAWCSSLSDVTIPNGVTSIGEQAFQSCKITSLNIPDSVKTIKHAAFFKCASLTNVTISASVTDIDVGAFSQCESLPKFEVDSKNPAYAAVDGILFDKNQTVLLAFPGARGGSYAVPDSVTKIGGRAFEGCKNLTSVSIPDSVLDCGGGLAFASCNSLKEIKVAAGNPAYSSVDGVLFDKEQKVLCAYPGGIAGSYMVPSGVTEIGGNAFYGAENLTDVIMLNSVVSIGRTAFLECSNLTKAVIPASVTKSGDRFESNAFGSCHKLKDVYYMGSETQWKAIESATAMLPESASVHCIVDVPSGSYFSNPVSWAIGRGITLGTTDTTFSPGNTCTTANIITFLWRANGSPAPSIANPFSDVPSGSYYEKAAVWAYEKGMVSGNAFKGGDACTRAATMKYLWILAGRPESGNPPFTDVSPGADYAKAVAWAVAQGVTKGTSDTTFSPNDTCTRGQIVTFLYRHYAH